MMVQRGSTGNFSRKFRISKTGRNEKTFFGHLQILSVYLVCLLFLKKTHKNGTRNIWKGSAFFWGEGERGRDQNVEKTDVIFGRMRKNFPWILKVSLLQLVAKGTCWWKRKKRKKRSRPDFSFLLGPQTFLVSLLLPTPFPWFFF